MLFGPLYCTESGARDRPTLLLLHGGGASHWVWSGVAQHLEPHFHLLLPDLLEHGRSGGRFSVVDTADLLAEVIRTLAPGGVAHVAGLSLGAQVGLELVGRYPAQVSSATLSGPLIYAPGWLEWAWNPRFATLARAVWGAYLPVRAFPLLTLLHTALLRVPPQHRKDYFSNVRGHTADGFLRMAREYLVYQPPEHLERSPVPTLLLTGPLELPQVKASVDTLARRLPGGRVGTVPVLEHNWLLENPGLFARAILEWTEGRLEAALEVRE